MREEFPCADYGQRLTRVETNQNNLRDTVSEVRMEIREEFARLHDKLDEYRRFTYKVIIGFVGITASAGIPIWRYLL